MFFNFLFTFYYKKNILEKSPKEILKILSKYYYQHTISISKNYFFTNPSFGFFGDLKKLSFVCLLWKVWKLMITWLVCHKITELYTKVPMMTCKQPKTHITSQRSPSHRRHSLQKTLNRKKDCGTFIYSKHFNILNQSYMKSSCGKISFKITCRILPVFETGIYDDKTRMHIHKKER